jgi:cell wall-associated NlpC family hydrolase
VYETTAKIRETLPTLRQQIVNAALTFNGGLYTWGGRSAPNKSLPTAGVDCSALINLSYRTAGLDVPRVAHEQFLYAQPIKQVANLRPGDLVFLAPKEKPDRMTHVMMYIGNEKLIEATGSDGINRTRIVTFKQKLGRPLAGLKNGQPCGNVIVHFGSLLGSRKMANRMRSQALKSSYD